MRTALGLTAALSAGLLLTIACGTKEEERGTARALARDLTLQTPATPAVEIASAVELGRPEPRQQTVRHPRPSAEPALAPTPDPRPMATPRAEPVSAPAPAPAALEETPAPAPSGRELAPGQSVTVLPASTGSATGSDDLYVPGDDAVGFKSGGGHCPIPPRRGGRPIGIIGFR